jgi:hypothetical protein
MREVQIVESLKYGARTFLYFITSVILGGGGIALGFAVGYNAVTIFGTGGDPVIYDTPELIAGVVLVILGGTVLFTGLFGLGYKLLADSVTAGYENTRAQEVSRESPTERGESVTSTAPEPTTEHSEVATDVQPGGREPPTRTGGTTATAGQARANDAPEPGQPSASAGEPEGNGDRGEEPDQVPHTGETEHQRTAQSTESEARRETAGESQATPATEPEVPQQDTSQARDQNETQPTEQEPTASGPQARGEEDADQWGPPGHSGQSEASSTESTASDTDQTGSSEPPDEQGKEQTAGEIAFGRGAAETTDEQSTTSTERAPSPESETDEVQTDRPEDDTGDDTVGGEEPTQQEAGAVDSPDDDSGRESVPEQSERPGEKPAPSQQEEGPEESGTDEKAGGDEGEEPLVPEYDEIPNDDESADTDSENGDPLGDPLDEEN